MSWTTQSLVDLLDIQPPPYLVDGFLRQHTITMVSSEPHLGKTMLMLDLAICMETKTKFLDTFEVPINSSSVILAQDSARWDVAIQFQKLVKGHQLTPQQVAMFDSRIMTRSSKAPRLFDSQFGPWCKMMREEHSCDVIMFDTHRRFHDANENDSGEMSDVMGVFERLVDDFGMTVVSNQSVGSTDHVPFDNAGLPGFQFLQDRIPGTGGHTNLDYVDAIQAEDLMKNAVVMAAFVYQAAMSDTKVPRKSR